MTMKFQTKSRTAPLTAVAALSLMFASCGSAPPYAAQPIEDDAEMTSNVVIADSELYDVIRVGAASVERVEGTNQLRVVVPIRNIDDEQVQILAQMSFLNLQKQPIGDDTNRQVKIVPSGSTITHTVVSRSADAKDWTLRLSWNK